MEINIKCSEIEESVVFGIIKEIDQELAKNINNIEFSNEKIQFRKTIGRCSLNMDEDISTVIIRKLGTLIAGMRFMNKMFNESIADIMDNIGDADFSINVDSATYNDQNKLKQDVKETLFTFNV